MIVHFAVFAAALPPIRLRKISKYLSYNQIIMRYMTKRQAIASATSLL